MAVIPLPGWKVDPNNPNGVVQDGPPINFGSTAYGAVNSPYPVAPPQQSNVRDLQLRSGDPATTLQSSGSQAQGVASGSSGGFDGGALLQLLQKYQKQAVTQGFNAQQQQVNAGLAQTPDSLIGASPSIQNSVRNAKQNEYDPTIQGAQQTDVLLRDQISNVRSLLKDQQEIENKKRDDARAVIKDAFTMGGADSMKGLDAAEITALEKAAGYPKGYIEGLSQTIRERELALKKQTNGLTNAQISQTVNQIAGSFDNEPLVREYNTINTGVNYIKTLGVNPTDDIARIYQFAKIMDPNSAVREGEYSTVQQYATAVLQRFGLNANRVFNNDGFLTTEARRFLETTLERRLAAARAQYKNTYDQYQKRIEQAKTGNLNSLTDYSQTQFDQQPPGNDPGLSNVFDTLYSQYGGK